MYNFQGHAECTGRARCAWDRLFLFMVVSCLALMAGCAASLQNSAPQMEPITVQGRDLKPISFRGVVIRIPVGQGIGSHHEGLMKVPQYTLNWQSGIVFGSEEFTLGASETLRRCGYKVLGGDNLLFGTDEGAKANYQLGGTIVDLKYNTFGSLAGNYNEAVVYVEWQLYDAFEKKIICQRSTEGFAKMSPQSKPAVFDAFNNALRNLLAEQEFVTYLERAQSPLLDTTVMSVIEIDVSDSSTALDLPGQLDEILPCVVTIRVGATVGSGFVVSSDGYVVTAAHVVAGVSDVQLVFQSGLSLTASVVRLDNHQDIALLKLPGSGHKHLPLSLDPPPLGSAIFAIGTPASEDLSLTVTRGIVSGLREADGVQFLQTDASLNPGNSGGPLLNERGQVVAVVSWKIAAVGFEGLAFGVPIGAASRNLNILFR